jgi:hypothetical protein
MDRTVRGPGEDGYHLAMKAVAAVAADAVAVAAAVVATTVAAGIAVAGRVAVTAAAAEIAAGRTVGEGTEARLETWYEDSERPCVRRDREEGRKRKVVSIDWGRRRGEKEGRRDRCLGWTTRG